MANVVVSSATGRHVWKNGSGSWLWAQVNGKVIYVQLDQVVDLSSDVSATLSASGYTVTPS